MQRCKGKGHFTAISHSNAAAQRKRSGFSSAAFCEKEK
jgi:hypothetical protein